ncbi:sigma 54 modulation/S30EA ribosomal C-terminal domain-containing protein [Nocardia stercoris]|nr:sigma 54 modulation/S30EA ribosomal C-terminal domain-containing protein [Nocardia stercoris]
MLTTSPRWAISEFPDIIVDTSDGVQELERERVAGLVGRMLERYGTPASARVRMRPAGPDDGPLLVQVNLQISGRPVRMQTLSTDRHNVLAVARRLRQQINQRPSRPRNLRTWPDPTREPLTHTTPAPVARRKDCDLSVLAPTAAVIVMDEMDYDVHLFTDADTGEDAIVYRAGPTGARLARQRRADPPATVAPDTAVMTVNPRATLTLTETQAVQRLCEFGLPHLFYTDPDTGRGHLLYRRYDHDLTLITPTAPA